MSHEAVVAGRYARALFEVAKAKRRLEVVLADMGSAERAIFYERKLLPPLRGSRNPQEKSPERMGGEEVRGECKDLFQKLRHPLISAPQKKAAMRSALGDLSPLAVKFLELLIEKKRIGILPEIMAGFRREVDKELGISRVDVTSAYPLSTNEEKGLQSALAKKLGKKLSISYKTDKALLGGLVVRAGMRIWDGSLRSALHKMKQRFAN